MLKQLIEIKICLEPDQEKRVIIPSIYAVNLKLLNIEEVLLQGILIYMVCAGENPVDMGGIIYFENLVCNKRVCKINVIKNIKYLI